MSAARESRLVARFGWPTPTCPDCGWYLPNHLADCPRIVLPLWTAPADDRRDFDLKGDA